MVNQSIVYLFLVYRNYVFQRNTLFHYNWIKYNLPILKGAIFKCTVFQSCDEYHVSASVLKRSWRNGGGDHRSSLWMLEVRTRPNWRKWPKGTKVERTQSCIGFRSVYK